MRRQGRGCNDGVESAAFRVQVDPEFELPFDVTADCDGLTLYQVE